MSAEQKSDGAVSDVAGIRTFPKGRKLKAIIIAGAILLALLFIGLSFAWYHWASGGSELTVPTKTTFQNAEGAKNKGDFAAAADMSTKAYDEAKSDEDKYMMALQAGSSYQSNKQYQQAIEWYLKAAALRQKDPASAAGLARSYDALGDKQKAIEYYQKTIDWYDRTDQATASSDIYMYEQLLKKAKGE